MNIYNEKINYIISLLGTVFVWLFGAWDIPLMTLVTVMFIDYITGITRAYFYKQLSSEYGFRGIYILHNDISCTNRSINWTWLYI